MGNAVNKKAGIDFNGDYRKKVLHHLGQFKNLVDVHYRNLAGADQYELDRAFDALPDDKVKKAWEELKKAKKV